MKPWFFIAQAVKLHFNSNDQPPAYWFQFCTSHELTFEIAQTGSMNRIYIFSCIAVLFCWLPALIIHRHGNGNTLQNVPRKSVYEKLPGAGRRRNWFFHLWGLYSWLFWRRLFAVFLSNWRYHTSIISWETDYSACFTNRYCLLFWLDGNIVGRNYRGCLPRPCSSSPIRPKLLTKVRQWDAAIICVMDWWLSNLIPGAPIFATLVVWCKMKFIGEKDLGSTEQIVTIIQFRDQQLKNGTEVIKARLLENSDILNVSVCPVRPVKLTAVREEPGSAKEGAERSQVFIVIDTSFLNHIRNQPGCRSEFFVLKSIQWCDYKPTAGKGIGLYGWGNHRDIICTVTKPCDRSGEDFHFQDFRQIFSRFGWGKLHPPLSYYRWKWMRQICKNTLTFIEKTLRSGFRQIPVWVQLLWWFVSARIQPKQNLPRWWLSFRDGYCNCFCSVFTAWFSVCCQPADEGNSSQSTWGISLFRLKDCFRPVLRACSGRVCAGLRNWFFLLTKRWFDEFGLLHSVKRRIVCDNLCWLCFTITGCTLFFRSGRQHDWTW